MCGIVPTCFQLMADTTNHQASTDSNPGTPGVPTLTLGVQTPGLGAPILVAQGLPVHVAAAEQNDGAPDKRGIPTAVPHNVLQNLVRV